MKSSLIASGLISLASAAAIPKDPMASGPAGPPNPGASLIYVDNAIEKADNRRCEKWGLVKTPRNAFWPVCTTWVLYAAQRLDYTLIAAQITNGECLAWTVLTANNKIIPICDGSVDKTIVNVVEPPAQQQKREVSADRGLLVQENVVKGEDKEPHSPPYASASAEPTPPFASASADASGSATSTASSSSAIGTIPPTELVKLIAPLHKKVEQNEAELRQAKGQLRKLDPSNPLAMGGAEGGEEGKDSGFNKQTPSEDKKETAVTDNETPQESSQKLNDDLHSVHTPKRRYNNTKRQFPPGPAPKFTTTSGQSIASLSQKITELTEELKVARSQLHAYRTTQKHQNEHPMETEEELGYGQGKTMTPVRPKQPQQQEQSAQGHTVIGAEQRGGGGNKKATVEENGAKQGGE